MGLETIGDRFRVLGAIGAGNMGEVNKAEDLQAPVGTPERTVAIKTILRRRSGALVDTRGDLKAVARFAREVRIMRRLDHPHLTRLIDGGVDESNGGLPYLAMEYLDGETLRDLVAEEEQLPVSWAAAIGAQIADGLSAAHAAGVVHRDLKPANVMLTRGGTVKILDFGMGCIADDSEDIGITSTGVAVGTARYMAPEQFEAKQATQAADLYALGCVLYEMLAGVPPFVGHTAHELAHKHLYEAPPPLRLIRSDIPPELARLIDRLLAKDPADRPADAVAARDALLPLIRHDGDAPQVPTWSAFDPVRALRGTARPAAPAGLSPAGLSAAGQPAPGQSPAGQSATARCVIEPGRPSSTTTGMDVFGVHRKLIDDYRSFTEGGTVIRDDRIAEFVEDDLNAKSQWPDPWLSLNPYFAAGGTVLELAGPGRLLHEECARIFQAKKTQGGTVCDGRPLTLHQHQREAVEAAQSGASYVLTTGTGSGKSLSYIVPIVDRVLKDREAEGPNKAKHVRAIIVYPMNALANSQLKELEKYLRDGYANPAVTRWPAGATSTPTRSSPRPPRTPSRRAGASGWCCRRASPRMRPPPRSSPTWCAHPASPPSWSSRTRRSSSAGMGPPRPVRAADRDGLRRAGPGGVLRVRHPAHRGSGRPQVRDAA